MKKTKEKKLTNKEWQIKYNVEELAADILFRIHLAFSKIKDLTFSDKCFISYTALTHSMANILLNFDSPDEELAMKIIDSNTKKLKSIVKMECKRKRKQKNKEPEDKETKVRKKIKRKIKQVK